MADTPVRLSTALADRFRIERELGRGGMGAVYLAADLRLDRLVALKVLPPEFASDSGLRERFLRETRTAASFSHPNIVPVHSVEEDGASLAFVMGFVEGESLAARVARAGPLDTRSTVRMLQDVAYALAYAHGRGVVHRDIKPDNIMIERATGRALVMDFGISRTITPQANTPGLTRVGEVVGTPEYMSPEQASGDNVDGRSDLYSLGLVALFAVTGRVQMTGESTHQIIVRQLTETLPPAASLRTDLPPALADAIDRCVAKEPGARFASAEALVEAIDNAKLSTPEIPIPIRMFVQEAGTVGLTLTFIGIVSWLLYVTASQSVGTFDAILPAIMLFGVVITRILQAHAEARRLGTAGFSMADVVAGMHAVLDERAVVRAGVAADPAVRARRKRTLVIAMLQLPLAIFMLRLALTLRVQIAPTQYLVGPGATMLVISGFLLTGISVVLILRSPFRAPVGERAFRLVWLGPFGRAFLRSAMGGSSSASPPRAPGGARPALPVVRPPVPPVHAVAAIRAGASVSSAAPADPVLASIDARLAAIEQALARRDGSPS